MAKSKFRPLHTYPPGLYGWCERGNHFALGDTLTTRPKPPDKHGRPDTEWLCRECANDGR